MDADFALVYLVAVGPVLFLSLAAVWRPRWWQVVLILLGPLITVGAALGLPPFTWLGWIATLGIPYAVLVVAPLIPWRRRWARFAIPAAVLAVGIAAMVAAGGEVAVLFYLTLPMLISLAALILAARSRLTLHAP